MFRGRRGGDDDVDCGDDDSWPEMALFAPFCHTTTGMHDMSATLLPLSAAHCDGGGELFVRWVLIFFRLSKANRKMKDRRNKSRAVKLNRSIYYRCFACATWDYRVICWW